MITKKKMISMIIVIIVSPDMDRMSGNDARRVGDLHRKLVQIVWSHFYSNLFANPNYHGVCVCDSHGLLFVHMNGNTVALSAIITSICMMMMTMMLCSRVQFL